ncbi:uncharacterized protein LOC118323390 [Morone saxatilis]|uniref:uncharacterized protein LOC118323390 n=1 Tax=Morone saxatilis TaxID=34816 RepID=UPI0015E22855|nr:uncharacterized protein LOC118323390 [Morone saxatilis]XP_035511241.1 uncharacterized protein LOC118323390 [Morone saxatilis]
MGTADQLLDQMFFWLEQRERCAEKLRKLAKELESLREKCNIREFVGSTALVVGSACLFATGVATFVTGGAAAPLLVTTGAVFSGTGVTISVTSKMIEHFSSSKTMKEAQRIEEMSNEVAEEIQRLFDELRANSSSADPDEVDQHVFTEILRAMARRSGLQGQININRVNNQLQVSFDAGPGNTRLNQALLNRQTIVGVAIILTFFSFKLSGTQFRRFLTEGAKQLIKQISTFSVIRLDRIIKSGAKTLLKKIPSKVLKGGVMVVGGAVGLAIELPEVIENWKKLIENNHVTEASQLLRDTADDILVTCRTLREQFNSIRQMFDAMAVPH